MLLGLLPDRRRDICYRNFEYSNRYITLAFIQMFLAAVYLILACLMVQGYRVRKHRLIIPWMVWSYISLPLATVGVVVLFVVIAIDGEVGTGLFIAISAVTFIALQTYFVSVVKRFVEDLRASGSCTEDISRGGDCSIAARTVFLGKATRSFVGVTSGLPHLCEI
ncbi:Voltage-dependent P/Q-type calcium channel subunit alpha-1A [Folsomia candida]|uniref:Voltage-dependent P/Q-type calcium channel subunit alpha-1A n=1 Tax=Folsomia candida TaxID=158441 RepID=A0A226DA80_FOLCA|nr:Voltage-dependent P/Q-type calcium channel subunit alpha-1A [Folsomia candida]